MGNEDMNRTAGISFHYPLVFFLNIALIIALEVLLVYKHPFPMTEEILSQQLPVYENAAIRRSTDKTFIGWYLLETENGEYHVVPVRRHALFFNRCKLFPEQIVVIPDDTAEMEVTTKDGIVSAIVLVGREVAPKYGEEPAGQMELRPKWLALNNADTFTYGFYFLMGLVLSILEYILWRKLKPQ